MIESAHHDLADDSAKDLNLLLPEAKQGLAQWTMAATVAGLGITIWSVLDLIPTAGQTSTVIWITLLALFTSLMVMSIWYFAGRHTLNMVSFHRLASAAILSAGLPILIAAVIGLQLEESEPNQVVSIPLNGLTIWLPYLILLQILASLLIPWPPLTSIQAAFVMMIFWSIAISMSGIPGWGPVDRLATVIAGFICLLPGMLIAAWRWNRVLERLEQQLLRVHVERLGGELIRAREVHEGLFPQPIEGAVRFEYIYEPNEQIGGDFVSVWKCPQSGRLTVTLMDVVGHGLTAALTVNRLSGELERLHAEFPDIQPGELMASLNRYIYLTMSRFSLFTTAACFQIDPVNAELRWALAGHPPAFIRREDGSVHDLECTSVLLGALPDDAYEHGQMSMSLELGDVIIGYTDGTIESRNADDEEFSIEAMRKCVAFDTPPRDWPRFILNAVERHHQGNQTDDILVVCLSYDHPHIQLDSDDSAALDSKTLFLGINQQ